MLNLAEELLLLALHDEKGRIVHTANTGLPYGIAGALLLELALRERIRFAHDKLVVVSSERMEDPALDYALEVVSTTDEDQDPEHWVRRLGKDYKEIKGWLLDELVASGILRAEERRFLWVIPYTRYPEEEGVPEDRVRCAVREAIRTEQPPDERMIALLSLVHACDLTSEIFEKEERKAVTKRLEALVEGEHVGGAVADIVKETQQAVMIAVMAASTVSIAAAGS